MVRYNGTQATTTTTTTESKGKTLDNKMPCKNIICANKFKL